jgi:hypothetical protein
VMGQHVALNHEAGMRNYGRVLMVLDPDFPVYVSWTDFQSFLS